MVDILFPGSVCQVLGREVADEIGVEIGEVTIKTFPDGERYLRVHSEVKGLECAVVQSTSRPQDGNILELITMLETLRDLGASRVVAVVPYMAYGRQDKQFLPGEALSSRVVAKHISMGCDEVITVNIHEEHILDFFTVKATNLDASPVLGDYFRCHELDSPLVIAPDQGAQYIAREVASRVKGDHDYLVKHRLAPGKVEMTPKRLAVDGKDVVLVDDMIDSGSTMLEAIKILREQGASSVLVGCVHPVLTGNVVARLFTTGAVDVVATNTIPSEISFITVSGLLSQALR
jgi:ribose-phosphate pyrophosphokinase